MAAIVIKAGRELDAEQVKEMFEGRLASYQHPKDVLFLDSLPHTALGKVDKYELRQTILGYNS